MEPGPGVLWTAVPIELVVDGLVPQQAACVDMVMEGRLVQVLPGENGSGTVQRLISGNAQDYLDPRWQPGTVVSLWGGE